MRALVIGLVLAALLAVPAVADMGGMDMGGEADASVAILTASYAPPQTDLLVGDTVRWSNGSIRAHTVTADSGAWTSGTIVGGEAFSHTFTAVGSESYYCKLHVFMHGVVNVHRVLLSAPAEPGAPGKPYALHGRAATAIGSTVAIEADSGGGFAHVADAPVDSSGGFDLDVTPSTTTTYRAVIPGETSPTVQLLVLDRALTAAARTRGRRTTVDATVAPASPGSTVVLQLHLTDRFGWWPVARTKLDKRSRARFALKLGHRYQARVLLTLADGATQLASSRVLHVGPR